MNTYLPFAFLLLPLAALAAGWALRSHRPSTAGTILHPRDVLQRDAQAMYLRLRTALPQYNVLARASLDAFVEVRGNSQAAVRTRQAELARQTVDFLICSGDFRVVAAVELEDSLHGRDSREHGSASTSLRAAAIPVLRWTTASLPTIRDIQEAVAEVETLRLINNSTKDRPPAGVRQGNAAGWLGNREPRL
jgi:hypothetical protein